MRTVDNPGLANEFNKHSGVVVMVPDKPKWSAVIIAYNEQDNIRKTVQSLLDQSIPPYRVVVVDDGSTDDTPRILSTLPVDVKHTHHSGSRYIHKTITIPEVRNVGLREVVNDPVDYLYSGDADIIIPPRYCEEIMTHAERHGAVVAGGIEPDKYIDLPMEGSQMFHRGWFAATGCELRWESIFICVKAWCDNLPTLVRHDDDCMVIPQRPTGFMHPGRAVYDAKGVLHRNMGMPLSFMCWMAARRIIHRRFRDAWVFSLNYIRERPLVPDDMRRAYGRYLYGAMKAYILRRSNPMETIIDGNHIFKPPSYQHRNYVA